MANKIDLTGWKRKEITTKGADPTVVVTWTNGGIGIQEFQGIYTLLVNGKRYDMDDPLECLKETHSALEAEYEASMESEAQQEGDYLDAKLYGHS